MPKRNKTNKRPKDPNAPKKPQSSYFLFANERRPALLAEKRGTSVTEISKIMSSEWKAMDATRRKDYEDRAVQERKQYALEFSNYKQTQHYRQFQIKLSEWKQSNEVIERSDKPPTKPKQPKSMPKRPQTSFLVFCNERRAQIKDKYPDKTLTEVSKLIANEWKSKTADEKKPYQDIAAQNKNNYNILMDEYKQTSEYAAYMEAMKQFKSAQQKYESTDPVRESNKNIERTFPRKAKRKKSAKKPSIPFFLYARETSKEIKQKFPSHSITDIAKEIEKKWKALSEDQKRPYYDKANAMQGNNNSQVESSDVQIAFKSQLQKWKSVKQRKNKSNVHGGQTRHQTDTDSDSSSSSSSVSSTGSTEESSD